jgi:hypothetical protein
MLFALASGMGWFRVTGGRLEYRGRITREAFTSWTSTREGVGAVARAAGNIRFSLIGRTRSARRRLWRALEAAARRESLAIGREAGHYMQVLASLSYATALPRTHIELHRLVVVPRSMIAGRAVNAVFDRLDSLPALADLDDDVRAFFLKQLVKEMDAALQQASPSPRRPILAQDEWACVGVNKGVVWVDPIWAGPDGTGHVFMYEVPRAGVTRRARKAVESAIQELTASLSSLSFADRSALVRAASRQ